jgi:hypothetical protein
MTRISDGRDAGAFITAALDDFGLDMPCFRIYARIVRRSGTKLGCFESIDNMAKACRMNRETAYRALKTLIKHRLIEKEPHPGRPSSYYLTPNSEWIPLPTCPKSGYTPPIGNEGIPPIGNEGIPPIGNEGIRRDQIKGSNKDQHQGGKNAVAVDPFYSGQHRAIAREVVKVSREMSGPRNFITDAPWGKLAEETGKDATAVFQAFEAYLIQCNSDKEKPEAYAAKVCSSIWSNPGSELACQPWKEFKASYEKNGKAPPRPAKNAAQDVMTPPTVVDDQSAANARERLKKLRNGGVND